METSIWRRRPNAGRTSSGGGETKDEPRSSSDRYPLGESRRVGRHTASRRDRERPAYRPVALLDDGVGNTDVIGDGRGLLRLPVDDESGLLQVLECDALGLARA